MNELQEEPPRKVGDPPKERHAESEPGQVDPDTEAEPAEPPPESAPGDSGEVPSPSQN